MLLLLSVRGCNSHAPFTLKPGSPAAVGELVEARNVNFQCHQTNFANNSVSISANLFLIVVFRVMAFHETAGLRLELRRLTKYEDAA
jgi:hypothetical protein